MIKKTSLLAIKIYQKTLSPDHGIAKIFFQAGVCKFRPTCSEYAYEAISKFGIIKGASKSLKRVLKCNPFSKGGWNPVEKQ